jgi:hypothetical protein
MSNPYEEHMGAVDAAIAKLEEVKGLLMQTSEVARGTQDLIVGAVGDSPRSQYGQEAMGAIAHVINTLDELHGVSMSCGESLTAYGANF